MTISIRLLLSLLIFFFLPYGLRADSFKGEQLSRKISRILRTKQVEAGVAMQFGPHHFTYHDTSDYPLMSVFKIHVALTALAKMEKEKTDLHTSWLITPQQMEENTYSPLRDLHPQQPFHISIEELLRYCLSESDNNACDILIAYAGGIQAVERQIHEWGIRDCSLTETEADMHTDIMNCYKNRSSLSSVVELLVHAYQGKLISGSYQTLFEQALLGTVTGMDKMRSGLPARIALGHKTGSSDRLKDGRKIGDNDAGIIYLPHKAPLFLAVFLKNSSETDHTNARLIARITQTVYRFVKKEKF